MCVLSIGCVGRAQEGSRCVRVAEYEPGARRAELCGGPGEECSTWVGDTEERDLPGRVVSHEEGAGTQDTAVGQSWMETFRASRV